MRTLRKQALALALAMSFIAPLASAGNPYPTRETPKAMDLGAPSGVHNAVITVTVALKLRNGDEMMGLMQGLYTEGSPKYHQFLSTQQFQARFAPTAATVEKVTRQFQAQGLTVRRVSSSLLSVTGSQDAIEKAFNVSLHTFEVPANGANASYRFHAPTTAPQVSSAVAANVQGVLGLDSRPRFRPHIQQTPDAVKQQLAPKGVQPAAAGAPATPDQPGLWTVTDFADYYDVQPLYAQGIQGQNRTIGIVTLASFTPSDAFTYWNSLGLATDPSRITVVDVDGGPGAPSDASGSDETTLDVEQSGGIAPAAAVIVYQAPNTDQGFVDAFAQAVDSNLADSISTSWGIWEVFPGQTDVTNPNTSLTENELLVFNDLFVQAALQGQSLFASSGDSGAYDANEVFPLPQFTKLLSVDNPSDEPFITAAGGTTLPGVQNFGSLGNININQEQAWGWDYLIGLCAKLKFDPVSCGIFPAGSGGGVSIFFPAPSYQGSIVGVRSSQSNQSLVNTFETPPQTLISLPGKFPGRNTPDVSFNADPDTGYIIPYTSSKHGFEVLTFFGGTSFVAPQLNGVTALLDQSANGRQGLLNFELYNLVGSGAGYKGAHPPLRDIVGGDNWFYASHSGYDLSTGVGVLDVANMAASLQAQ